MNNENQEEKTIDLEEKEPKKKKGLIELIESEVDWNLISIFSIWIFLCFTFFCIFVK